MRDYDYYEEFGYDDDIPWPENMPSDLVRCAKHLDIYKGKSKAIPTFIVRLETMAALAKAAAVTREISDEDLDAILCKIGL